MIDCITISKRQTYTDAQDLFQSPPDGDYKFNQSIMPYTEAKSIQFQYN